LTSTPRYGELAVSPPCGGEIAVITGTKAPGQLTPYCSQRSPVGFQKSARASDLGDRGA
jgi:hypothetical protein